MPELKIKRTTVYKFSELAEKVKEKVIAKHYDININHEWWDCVYDDAEQIGLKITSFDIGRSNYCEGKFIESAEVTAEAIIKNHGEQCETFITATEYLKNRSHLVLKFSDGVIINAVANGNEYEYDQECDDLDTEFLKSICKNYLTMLSNEYDYITSEEAIKETIEANDYDFTEDGVIYQ